MRNIYCAFAYSSEEGTPAALIDGAFIYIDIYMDMYIDMYK